MGKMTFVARNMEKKKKKKGTFLAKSEAFHFRKVGEKGKRSNDGNLGSAPLSGRVAFGGIMGRANGKAIS